MTVSELIGLLQAHDPNASISVGSYNGPHNMGPGWNESQEMSHGPIWVAYHNSRVFIGINCYGSEHKNDTYRTMKNGHPVTVDEYYERVRETSHERGRVHERGPGVSTCTPEIKQTLQRVLDGYQRAADLNEAARRWVLSL